MVVHETVSRDDLVIPDLSGWPQDLREHESVRRRAMCDAHIGTLGELLHDDLIYIHSNGLRDGKASHLAAIDSKVVRYVRLSSSEVQAIALGADVWLLTGRLQGDVTAGAKTISIDAAFTSVWWRELRWRLVSWQSTPWPRTGQVPPPAR